MGSKNPRDASLGANVQEKRPDWTERRKKDSTQAFTFLRFSLIIPSTIVFPMQCPIAFDADVRSKKRRFGSLLRLVLSKIKGRVSLSLCVCMRSSRARNVWHAAAPHRDDEC